MTRHSSAVLNASQAALAVTSSQWSAARNPTGARSCAAPAFFNLSPSAAWCLIRDRDHFDSPPDETVVQSYWAQRGGVPLQEALVRTVQCGSNKHSNDSHI